jgi:AMP deaminase
MLFLEYEDNPFPSFFSRGMNVSLSTDDPLVFHRTKNPLLEEYAVASQVYRLSPTDLAEIGRNSVLQSGFEYPFKAHWIGRNYATPGPIGNNIKRTNLPHIRLQYRLETLREELCLLKHATQVFRGTPSMATAFPSFYQAARNDEEKKLFILPSHKHH